MRTPTITTPIEQQLAQELAALKRRVADLEARPRLNTSAGTFTPTFVGTTTAGTFTYLAAPNNPRGVWRRYGDQVHIWGEVGITAITVAPTGNMTIGGLPFAAAAATFNFSVDLGAISNIDYPTSALEITAFIASGAQAISLVYTRDNLATLAYPAANFTNAAALIRFAGSYLI